MSKLIVTLLTGETRIVRRPAAESPERALIDLGDWLKSEDGAWIQRSAIAEVRVELDGDDELPALAADVEMPLSDQERAALAGEADLEAALEAGEAPSPGGASSAQ